MNRAVVVGTLTFALAACGNEATKGESEGIGPPVDGRFAEEPARSAEFDEIGAPWGIWRVADAKLTHPEYRVQAYGDAELEAARSLELVLEETETFWRGARNDEIYEKYGSFGDRCRAPKLVSHTRDGFGLACSNDGQFAPDAPDDAPFHVLPNGSITIAWWDGLTLVLERARK